MIEPAPGLPAHIALLLNERFDLDDFDGTKRKLRAMLRDLRAQVEATGRYDELPRADPAKFKVVLSGGLDLFANEGACQTPRCRVKYADHVARSIALMSDQVVLHDYLRTTIALLDARSNSELMEQFASDVLVLKRIEPLIAAGLIYFSPPTTLICKACHGKFEEEISDILDFFVAELAPSALVKRGNGEISVEVLDLYDPPVNRVGAKGWQGVEDAAIVRSILHDCVLHAMRDARATSLMSGTMFSNSPVGLRSLLAKEGRTFTSAGFRTFAGHRAADLPWVQGLTVEQTLALRQEAATALPVLRESLARKLSDGGQEKNLNELIGELREQAEQVRAELSVATERTPSIRKNALGVLGLGISALSVATGNLASAAAGLLSTLGLIHQVPRAGANHVDLLKSKPGYVLVAAQDILAHASLKD